MKENIVLKKCRIHKVFHDKTLKKSINLLTIILFFLTASFSFSEEEKIYQLDDLKTSMYKNNTDLRKLQEEYNRSLYDIKDAKASIGPTVTFQMTGTYMFNPPIDDITINVDDILNSINWPESYSPSSSGQYITLYEGMENTLYSLQMTLQQPIFTWGKLRDAVKLYKNVANVKQLQISSKTKQLDTELETRLMSLIYLYDIEDILAEEKTYADRMVTCAEDAEKAGMLLHQDVIEAQIQAKELDITVENINEQVQTQLLELQRLTGIAELSKGNLRYKVDDSYLQKIISYNRESSEEKALSVDKENLQMLDLLKSVNEFSTKIAKNSVYWKPDFAIEATVGYGGSRVPLFEENWLRKDDYTLNLSVGLKTTVWDGGKKLNAISKSISETNTSKISKDEALQTIKQTLHKQWNTIDVCEMRIEYQDLKIETAESKIKQQDAIFQTGYGSETDLLKAKIEKCNEQIEKIQQQLNLASSCFMIQYLVGE